MENEEKVIPKQGVTDYEIYKNKIFYLVKNRYISFVTGERILSKLMDHFSIAPERIISVKNS